jgi:hypothetical protein
MSARHSKGCRDYDYTNQQDMPECCSAFWHQRAHARLQGGSQQQAQDPVGRHDPAIHQLTNKAIRMTRGRNDSERVRTSKGKLQSHHFGNTRAKFG